ncbi:MAG: hypothetical protein LKK00_03745 [Intestinimonas sp.]|nr:hypothetical protein [Intestinimonas sp.]
MTDSLDSTEMCSGTCNLYQSTASTSGKYQINSGDIPSDISATCSTQLNSIHTKLIMQPDKTNVLPGWIITYTITFINQSMVAMYDVKISDTIPSQTTLVPDSIVPAPQEGESLTDGVTVGTVAPGASKTLVFQAEVSSSAAGSITDTASGTYNFKDWTGTGHTGSAATTTASVTVACVNFTVDKTADKTYVTDVGQDVVYTLNIHNNGTVPITNITVTDPIPSGMVYKANSTLHNDTQPYTDETPAAGIGIGTLAAGTSYKLQFTFTTTA